VVVVDERWCEHDPDFPVRFAFPFWLYRGDLEYFSHLLNTRSISAAWSRVELAIGILKESDPRGYIDYEAGRAWNFNPGPYTEPAPVQAKTPDPYFPAIEQFDGVLASIPSQMPVVIMMPPVYVAKMPRPGTQVAADLPACKAALAQRVAGRPRSAFMDFLADGPVSRDPENFMDEEHYRQRIARVLEARIVGVLAPGANHASE
jgi:hypothetical protein